MSSLFLQTQGIYSSKQTTGLAFLCSAREVIMPSSLKELWQATGLANCVMFISIQVC